MTTSLFDEIDELLSAIDETQAALARIYQAKRDAIRRANAHELDSLLQSEQALVARLQSHLDHRRRILERPGSVAAHETLESLAETFEPGTRRRLLGRIAQTREMADANRRESWVVWIVSQQSLRLFKEMF